MVFRSGPDTLLRTPSAALIHSALLRTLDIWLHSLQLHVKRQKPASLYRKRLCVIHCGFFLRGPVSFSSRDDGMTNTLIVWARVSSIYFPNLLRALRVRKKKGYYFRTYLKIVAEITFRVNLTEMLALSSLYAVCVWMSLACPSLGTGFVYHFPSITVQRQRIKSEQSGSGGPPGTGPRTQLRWAHVQSSDSLMSVSSKLISDTGSTKKKVHFLVSILTIYDMKSISILGIGVSTLFPKQCPVRCTTEQKPQCREFYRVVDGLDPAPKSSGNSEPTHDETVLFSWNRRSVWGLEFILLFCLDFCPACLDSDKTFPKCSSR